MYNIPLKLIMHFLDSDGLLVVGVVRFEWACIGGMIGYVAAYAVWMTQGCIVVVTETWVCLVGVVEVMGECIVGVVEVW